MLLYRMLYSPTALLDSSRIDTTEIEESVIAPFRALFKGGSTFFDTIPNASDVKVRWTGFKSGQALMTCYFQGTIFLSGILLGGSNSEADSELLQIFLRSLESAPIMKSAEQPNRFSAIFERKERPLLIVVLWPSLSSEILKELAGIDVLLAAAFLRWLT